MGIRVQEPPGLHSLHGVRCLTRSVQQDCIISPEQVPGLTARPKEGTGGLEEHTVTEMTLNNSKQHVLFMKYSPLINNKYSILIFITCSLATVQIECTFSTFKCNYHVKLLNTLSFPCVSSLL